MQVSEFAEQK